MMNWSKQAGYSITEWSIIIVVLVVFTFIGFKLAPPYMDDQILSDRVQEIGGYANVENMTQPMLWEAFRKKTSLDNVSGLTKENLTLTRKKGRFIAELTYEVRVPMIHNIEAVMTFTHTYDSAEPTDSE